jgi:hypothetical protein
MFEEVVGTKVEKKPPASGWQGSAKEDCVTEWFLAKKENSMWSPTEAWMSLGENFNVLFQPTLTGIVIACARASEAAAARAVEKYMVRLQTLKRVLMRKCR